MDLRSLQVGLLEDLTKLRNGEISVSQARSRALLARTLVEAEKTELVKAQMVASGTIILEYMPTVELQSD